jgi:hypothetical protein
MDSPVFEAETPAASAALCRLDHSAFSRLGAVAFRRSTTDGMPVMVVPLGEREASVPLRSLQRELAIADDSADGRMLGLIAGALDYVPGLAIGDQLPSEVVTGEASWHPAPHHLWLAASRLRMQLLEWRTPGSGTFGDDQQALHRLVSDPATGAQLQRAFEKAARVLGMPRPEDVVTAVDQLAHELSFIEALREGLLGRVQALVRRLTRVTQARGLDLHRLEMLQQVGRLSTIGLRQIRETFGEIGAHTGEIISTLRNADTQKTFIRSHRDGLYRVSLGWQPILPDWDLQPPATDDAFWSLVARSYQVLAPRYMPVTEWRRLGVGESHQARDRAKPRAWER